VGGFRGNLTAVRCGITRAKFRDSYILHHLNISWNFDLAGICKKLVYLTHELRRFFSY
jgi:hypothetical protein